MNIIFQTLTGQLMVVITLAFGALLIALYPLLQKENRAFAWFSVVMGIIVWLLLLWFTFGDPVIRNQILQYGLH